MTATSTTTAGAPEPDEGRTLVPRPDVHLSAGQVLSGLQTVRAVLAPDLTDEELRLFAMVATRSGLDPFARQVYAVKRQGRVTFQTGIDGYRSIAVRTGLYDGQDEPEFGPVCACGDNRPAGHPESATVRVYRKGVGRPIAASAYFHEYRPEPGPSGRGDAMWMRMPRVMLAKVAEASALRKGFPYDPNAGHGIGADVYTDAEMDQSDAPRPASVALSPRERLAARRAEIRPPDPSTPDGADGRQPEGPPETPPTRHLTREAFLALVDAAGVDRAAIVTAAAEVFPGIPSRRYSPAHWAGLAERLGLPDNEPQQPADTEPPATHAVLEP